MVTECLRPPTKDNFAFVEPKNTEEDVIAKMLAYKSQSIITELNRQDYGVCASYRNPGMGVSRGGEKVRHSLSGLYKPHGEGDMQHSLFPDSFSARH